MGVVLGFLALVSFGVGAWHPAAWGLAFPLGVCCVGHSLRTLRRIHRRELHADARATTHLGLLMGVCVLASVALMLLPVLLHALLAHR